jgi:hypothetical protein
LTKNAATLLVDKLTNNAHLAMGSAIVPHKEKRRLAAAKSLIIWWS